MSKYQLQPNTYTVCESTEQCKELLAKEAKLEAQSKAIEEAVAEIDSELQKQNYNPSEWVNDYCVGLLKAKEILTNKLK